MQPWGCTNDTSVLVQIMTWQQAGDKQLSRPMMTKLYGAIYGANRSWLIIPIRSSSLSGAQLHE